VILIIFVQFGLENWIEAMEIGFMDKEEKGGIGKEKNKKCTD